MRLHGTLRGILLGLCLMFSLVAKAAAPVTHLLAAEIWIEVQNKISSDEKRAFILGSLFPDIRYLGVISREKTHEKGLTLQDVKNTPNTFKKGMRLHALVDEVRDKFVLESKIYEKLMDVKGQEFRHTFLKLLEDEILFSTKKWDEVQLYLASLQPEQKEFEISDENLQKWHQKLIVSFRMPPSLYLANLSKSGKGLANIPQEIIESWSQVLPQYAKRPDMQAYVQQLMQVFEKTFKE